LQFTLWPVATSKHSAQSHSIGRVIVLYDNAGENFLPRMLENTSHVVQHLAQSKLIFMLFDPTQDSRFRQYCIADGKPKETVPGNGDFAVRQETLLREMAVRLRRYLQLSESKRITKPLIILVAKCDVWGKALGISLDKEPYTWDSEGKFVFDFGKVETCSNTLRQVFNDVCPELVATAENLTPTVRFLPISSLGTQPDRVEKNGEYFYGIRPCDIHPRWVTVPLIYSLLKWAPSLSGKTAHNHCED
jgi:hypothetical protein